MKPDALSRAAKPALALVLALACAAGPAAAEVQKYAGGPIIAELVTRLLEQTHYAKKPIDANVSKQFLENYLESYDYNHMILDKSDVDEFEAKYGSDLGALAKDGNVDPAYEIYDRVEKRLEERVALVKRLTASTFTFTTDENVVLDRHDAPWPTAAEAKELWRLRIKNEVLQERLTKIKAEQDKAAAAKTAAAKAAAAKTTKTATAAAPATSTTTAVAAAVKKPVKELSTQETIDTRYERLLRSYKEYDGTDILQDYL
ncbi:MAG: hypothetical protein ACRDL8_19780, partial [Solirubrobacteraceae bacterium]